MIEVLQAARPAPMPDVPLDPTERVVARVRLRAQLRILWLRGLWRREKDLGVRSTITHEEVDACLEGWDAPGAEAAFLRSSGEARALVEMLERVEAALDADRSSRLSALVALFELTPKESDLLQACFAVSLDPALGRTLAYIQDVATRAYPTENLVARLFGHGHARALEAESALRRWELVIAEPVGPGEPRALSCDPMVRAWLLGERRLDEPLTGVAQLLAKSQPLPCWPVDAVAARIERVLASGDRLRLIVSGTPGSGRRTFASAVAAKLGLPLLVIRCDAVDDQDWPRVFLHAQRQAYLDRCALAWTGERVLRSPWPQGTTHFPVQFVIAEPGQAPLPLPSCLDDAAEMPKLSLAERTALWRELVPGAAQWPEQTLRTLVARHRLVVGEIADLGRRPITGPEEAAQVVRETSRYRLGELARWVECPFGWEDLVLPETLRRPLSDFLYEAEERAAFWEQQAPSRLFPQGQGLFALFSGAPGTGKTMAAQVIAARLGLDLFRISLSFVVSKYVGETSKNLQRIFARAEEMDAVLLFDEADALFGKRTEIKDAHDRFANTDTNYLLQAIEAYRGIALLATNKKANVDPAFLRRIRYVLDFPKPEAAERRQLWGRLVAELAGEARAEQLSHTLDLLAQTVEATGAQIKYAVLTALFAARRDGQAVGIEHLLRGLERELIKEGRALTERDRERLREP
jgi:adenylate kinase family enzyme